MLNSSAPLGVGALCGWFDMTAGRHGIAPLMQRAPHVLVVCPAVPSAKLLNGIHRALAELKFDPKVVLAEDYGPSWPKVFRSLVEMKPSAVGFATFTDCGHAYGVKITWQGAAPFGSLSFTI
ncbi:MAG: hypothetical protein ACKER6_01345 [Candidatus Hodgkinia cicadicola]